VTYGGEVVGLLVPVPSTQSTGKKSGDEAVGTDLDHLAAEIGTRWPKGVSAVEATRDGRDRP
jgi:hypothetical protein